MAEIVSLREAVATLVRDGDTVEEIVECGRAREATGRDLRVADDLEDTGPPTDDELSALRSLRTKGAAE